MKKAFLIEILVGAVISFQLFFFFLPDEIRYPLFLILIALSSYLYFQDKSILIPKIFISICLFWLLFIIISGIFSAYPFRATLEVIKYTGLFVFLILCFNLVITSNIWRIWNIVISVVVFWGLAGIIEYTSRDKNSLQSLFEPFHWPTLASSVFVLFLPYVFYKLLHGRKGLLGRNINFATSYILIAAWVLTSTYLPLLVFCLFSVLWLHLKTTGFKLKQFYVKGISIVILLIALLATTLPNFLPSFGDQPLNKEVALFQNNIYFYDNADVVRFSTNILSNHFWWGIGPEVFGPLYQNNLKKSWTWSEYASNEFLQTIVENGVFGFIGELLIYLYLIIICLKNIKLRNNQELYLKIFSGSVALFLLLSLTNISMRIFPVEIIVFLLVSYILKREAYCSVGKRLCFVLTIPFLFVSATILFDSYSLRSVQKVFTTTNTFKTIEVLNNLAKRPKYLLNPKVFYWLSTAYLDNDEKQESLEVLRTSLLYEPYNEEIQYQIAKLHYLNGNNPIAKETIEGLLNRNPFSPPKIYLALANIYLEENNKTKAEEILQKAWNIFPLDNPRYRKGREILDAIDYSPSLRQITYLLYTLTRNKNYLNCYYQYF